MLRQSDEHRQPRGRQPAVRIVYVVFAAFFLPVVVGVVSLTDGTVPPYYDTVSHLQESIKGVQEEIGKLKEGLVVERLKRCNKEVYEEVCKDVNTHPPHRETKVRRSLPCFSALCFFFCAMFRSDFVR